MALGTNVISFWVTDIDLKSTGITTVIPVRAGKYFLFTTAALFFRTLTSATGNPTAKLQGAHTTIGAVDFTPATAFDRTKGVGQPLYMDLNSSSNFYLADLDTAVSFNVTGAATGTTVTGDLYVEGILF